MTTTGIEEVRAHKILLSRGDGTFVEINSSTWGELARTGGAANFTDVEVTSSLSLQGADIFAILNFMVSKSDFDTFWDTRMGSFTFSTALTSGVATPTVEDILTQSNQNNNDIMTLDTIVNVHMLNDFQTMLGLVNTNIGDIASLTTTTGTHTTDIAALTTSVGTHTTDIAALASSVGTHTSDIQLLTNSLNSNTNAISANTSSLATLTNTTSLKFDKTGGPLSGPITVAGDVTCTSMTSNQTTFYLRGGVDGLLVTGPQPIGVIYAKIDGTGIETPYALTASATIAGDVNVTGVVNSTRICCNFILDQNTSYSWADVRLPINTLRYNNGFYANNGYITVSIAGLYQIDYHVSTSVTSMSDRTQSSNDLWLNGAMLPQTTIYHYNREFNRGYSSSSMSLILELAASDVIQCKVRKIAGNSNVQAIHAGVTLIKL